MRKAFIAAYVAQVLHHLPISPHLGSIHAQTCKSIPPSKLCYLKGFTISRPSICCPFCRSSEYKIVHCPLFAPAMISES